jgi:hypothetical protein
MLRAVLEQQSEAQELEVEAERRLLYHFLRACSGTVCGNRDCAILVPAGWKPELVRIHCLQMVQEQLDLAEGRQQSLLSG